MSDSNKTTKSVWPLRAWILILAVGGAVIIFTALPVGDCLYQLLHAHGLEQWNGVIMNLWIDACGICLLSAFVLSIVGLFRRDWVVIFLLFIVLVAALLAFMVLKRLSNC